MAAEAASRRLQDTLQAVQEADVIVVVAATTATESADRFSLSLDNGADLLIQAASMQKPTVVLMEIPGPVLTPWRAQVSALACLFTGGERTGKAWASLLFGDIMPAGKLPVAMPSSEGDSLRPHPGQVYYSEGLFTSYRSPAFSSAYPFGHGLTFTSFSLGKPERLEQGCYARLCLRTYVTNTGPRAGKEVIQAYVRFAPDTGEPDLLLRGFRKTPVLAPQERGQVDFFFSDRDLSIYDERTHSWQLQQSYELFLGLSSVDHRGIFRSQSAAYRSVHATTAFLLALFTAM